MADPLAPTIKALRRRSDLLGWRAKHSRTRSEQLFSGRTSLDARRAAEHEEISIEVVCPSAASDSGPMCGAAGASFAPGDDPARAIEFAVEAAGRTRNPIYDLPSAAPLPEVPLADETIVKDAAALVESLHARLTEASKADHSARLTLAEWFADTTETHLVNSNGIDAHQAATELSLEWIVLAGQGQRRVETILDLSRRRAQDLDVEAEWASVARHTADRHEAGPAPTYQGPVVLHGRTISTFLNSGVFETLASGRARFAKLSPWEIGKSVLKGETKGDPLTIWANRVVPYGTNASRFDAEGIPGQCVLLVEDGILRSYAAGQRYATYLHVPATGAFGDFELPPGNADASELVAEPHIEIVLWSWFSPNPTTGDFAAEIRLGYQVANGARSPFSGGMLVGNVLEALGNARWDRQLGFFGDYQGPRTVRFGDLKVVPSRG